MEVEFSVVSAGAFNDLERYRKAAQKEWGFVLRQSLRRTAVNLVYQTQPFGNGPDSRERGRRKIAKDMGKVYATIGSIYEEIMKVDKTKADAFYAMAFQGKWKRAEKILRATPIYNRNTKLASFDGGTAHNSRFKMGRLRGGKIASIILKNEKSAFTYLKKKQALVGFGKSGWVEIARKLGGTRGIPGWVSRLKGPGSVKDRTLDANPVVFGTNEVSYISDILTATQVISAIDREEKVAKSQAEKAERAAAKQARLA